MQSAAWWRQGNCAVNRTSIPHTSYAGFQFVVRFKIGMLVRGIATIPLDTGRCPRWLFERMVRLAREMIFVARQDYRPNELLRRVADPVWFQSLGTVLAFDWNSSGLTLFLLPLSKKQYGGKNRTSAFLFAGERGESQERHQKKSINGGACYLSRKQIRKKFSLSLQDGGKG